MSVYPGPAEVGEISQPLTAQPDHKAGQVASEHPGKALGACQQLDIRDAVQMSCKWLNPPPLGKMIYGAEIYWIVTGRCGP